jgi:hypothetical protein
MQAESRASSELPARSPARIWLALEAPEIIEVKRIMLDRDAAVALDFFNRVIVPRVMSAARRRGLDYIWDESDGPDERLSG